LVRLGGEGGVFIAIGGVVHRHHGGFGRVMIRAENTPATCLKIMVSSAYSLLLSKIIALKLVGE